MFGLTKKAAGNLYISFHSLSFFFCCNLLRQLFQVTVLLIQMENAWRCNWDESINNNISIKPREKDQIRPNTHFTHKTYPFCVRFVFFFGVVSICATFYFTIKFKASHNIHSVNTKEKAENMLKWACNVSMSYNWNLFIFFFCCNISLYSPRENFTCFRIGDLSLESRNSILIEKRPLNRLNPMV